MSFNPQEAQQVKREYELPDEGLYPARLARVIEIGDQETKYGVKTQVILGFTVPSLTMEIDGETKQRMFWTFGINQTSNPDGTLMKYVKALNPTATHMKDMLGKACMLELAHSKPKPDGTQYANISSITKPMAGIETPEPDIETYMYEFENREDEIFGKIGEYRQQQVRAAKNWEVA